jgi:hypothetical protein
LKPCAHGLLVGILTLLFGFFVWLFGAFLELHVDVFLVELNEKPRANAKGLKDEETLRRGAAVRF